MLLWNCAAVAAALMATATNKAPEVTTFNVALSGAAETNLAHPLGGTGDISGSGSVILKVDPAKKQICYDFALSGLATPLMAHIHQGPPLSNGPPVVTLLTGPERG